MLWVNHACTFQELWGNGACKSVVCGNAQAELLARVLIPLALWLLLVPGFEQPQSSMLPQWPSLSASISIIYVSQLGQLLTDE